MRSALAATALGITLTVAALASCAGQDEPGEPPGPEPSVTPVFASEEEALEAAGEAYQAYLDVANAIGQAGWADTTKYYDVLRSTALDEELDTAVDFASKNYVQVGASTFDSLTIQQIEDDTGRVVVTVYLCLDVSQVNVVDATGASVVSPTRPDRQALEVELDGENSGALLIGRSEAWSGASFC